MGVSKNLSARLRGFLCGLLVGGVAVAATAETITGRVVAIADGDTLTVLDDDQISHRIRLAGIDAPEKRQAFGAQAKHSLSGLAFNQPAEASCRKQDRYGRSVCVVQVAGRDVGLAQVQAGLAWWYREYAREQTAPERNDYEAAEVRAKAQRHGLWRDENSEPPWVWRRARRAPRLSADGG